MKKYLFAALALSFLTQPAFAEVDKTNFSAYKLIKSLQHPNKVRKLDQAPILKFMPSPAATVEQGREYSVFIAPLNSYSNSNALLDATVDTVPVGLIRSSENLWIYHSAGFSEQRGHSLTVSLSVENKELANQIRNSIDRLSNEIFKLQKKIDVETDPVKKQTFISQRDEKVAIKAELTRQLAELKTPVSSQTFDFAVVQKDNDSLFPKLTGVSPQAGPASGGVPITISGENFISGMTVKIGGLTASASLVNATTITATVPNFGSSLGIKDLEVRFPPLTGSTEVRNSFLRNAYFVTNSSLEVNVNPIAVAGPHRSYLLGEAMNLDGSGSYDNNSSTTLSYEWKVVDAPAGSGFTPGAVLSTDAQPSLSITAVGYYIFELKVTEVNTQLHLVSEASLATVEVHGPVNHAPVPTAGAITAYSAGTASTTVAPHDVDLNQSWTFTVISPPAHGNAPINAQGVVFYTSVVGYTGSDPFTVRVTDSGSPAKFGDVVIPVTVGPANAPPVLTAPPITVNISNPNNRVGTSQIAVSDATGTSWFYSMVAPFAVHGTAFVNASGLVTYNAFPGFEGSESVRVRVFDNGAPQKFSDLVIPVLIPNTPPILGAFDYKVKTKGLPVKVTLQNFSQDSDGSVVEWSANYGDGTPVDKIPTPVFAGTIFIDHEYASIGNFNVILTAKDNKGATTVSSGVVNITNQNLPVNQFTMSTDRGAVPLTVTFDASASVAGDSPINNYNFEFGDGSPQVASTNPIQTHTYTTPGDHFMNVLVEDGNHGQAFALSHVYPGVSPPGFQVGAASWGVFEYTSQREQVVGSTFSFDVSHSNNPNAGGSFVSYDWTFGDWSSCGAECFLHTTIPTASHQYNVAGNYFPTAMFTTDQGDTVFAGSFENLVVNSGHSPRAVIRGAGLTPDRTSGVGPYTLTVNGLNSYDPDGSIQSYTWNFMDPDTCPALNCVEHGPYVSHTYVNPNFYHPSLTVTDSDGNSYTANMDVSVTPGYRAVRTLSAAQEDPNRAAQRRNLSGACAAKNAPACYFLGKMYAEDGDTFSATKLYEQSCSLGYAAACSK